MSRFPSLLSSAARGFPASASNPRPSLNFSTPFAQSRSSTLNSSFGYSFPNRAYSTPHRSRQATNYARARPFIVLLGFMPVFTFALGTWQVKRLQWKLDMIQQLEDKLNQTPVGLPPKIESAEPSHHRLPSLQPLTATPHPARKLSPSLPTGR